MNALGTIILFVVLATVLCAPPRWALLACMAGVLFLTQGQNVKMFGLNFYAFRFVELTGFIRVVVRRELSLVPLAAIDRALLLLYIYTTAVFLLRSSEGALFVIGVMIDAFLCYFTFRGLLRGADDFRWFLRALLLLLVPFVALVLIESVTMHNPFSIMGAVQADDFIRAGRLRCQASFRHPILMGTVGASFLPLYIGLGVPRGHRVAAGMGIVLCLAIAWASNSGGPASCVLVAALGWCLWRWRVKMRLVRRALVASILLLGLVMKAPVWYVLDRVSLLTGGGGWHRSFLVDMAIKKLGVWWLAGMPITDTVDWFPYSLSVTGGADMTNAFIAFGITAGIVAMGLFVALLVTSYRQLGLALAAVRSHPGNETKEFLLWGVGVMLAVHIVNWLGITYFDQMYVVWFLQLAAVANLSNEELVISATGQDEAPLISVAAFEY